MNCERVNLLLDTKSAAELTAAERQAVDQHLASCSECREMWEAYDELAALRIPATPSYLRVRIATALAARVAGRSHARLVMGAVLLAGAALAATAVLRWTNDPPDPAPDPVPAIEEVAPVVEPVVAPAPEQPPLSDEPVPSPPEPVEPIAASDATYPLDPYLDPYSIVVVAVSDPTAGEEAAVRLAGCYDAIVERLRSVAGLNVIAGEHLRGLSRHPEPEFQAARELGAGSMLVLTPLPDTCLAVRYNLQTRVLNILGSTDPQRAELTVERLRDQTFKDSATILAERRGRILDPARSEEERLNELLRLRPPDPRAPPTTFDEATVAAAVQIALTSRDANRRGTAWLALLGVTDPQVVQPALYALENDAENVRTQAALALAPFADQPAVREALTRAAAVVPSERARARAICCFFTVRSAARLALRAGEDNADAVRKNVLDESLTPQERLVLRGIYYVTLSQIGDEAARAVFALGSSSDDEKVRSRAWHLLSDVSEKDFIPALLEDLARHSAESVRAAAAEGLTQHRDDPDVRAALDRALADSSGQVQRAARNALDGARVY